MVGLSRCLSNPRKAVISLVSHADKASKPRGARHQTPQRADMRGPVVERALQTQTRLSTSNRAALLAGYVEGAAVTDLVAARFGVHRKTVMDIARRAGVPVRRPPVTDSVRQEAALLYAEGLTLSEVAKCLGINEKTPRAGVVTQGIGIRPRGPRPSRAGV